MNHVYRVVFNHALKCVQVVSEFARSRSTVSSSAARRAPALAALSTAIALGCFAPSAFAGLNGWNEFRGTIDNNWGVNGNWEFGEPNGLSAAAYIDGSRTAEVTALGEQTAHIHVGYTSRGNLAIFNGGQLTSATIFVGTGDRAGTAGTADGRVTISGAGSRWTSLTTIGVGHLGYGQVDIDQGGVLSMGTDSYIGAGPTGRGLLTVTGTNSLFHTGRTLLLGNEGNGEVRVSAGGQMTSLNGIVGNTRPAVGAATITGNGSRWVNSAALTLGEYGQGTLTVADSASAEVGGTLVLGNLALNASNRSSGRLVVTGTDSSFTHSGNTMTVGNAGVGEIQLRDGAAGQFKDITFGVTSSGIGTTLISDAGTTWDSGALRLGVNGYGRFDVRDGALATVRGNIVLGEGNFGAGYVLVGSDATLDMVGANSFATITTGSNGMGWVELNGGTLRASTALRVDSELHMAADSTLQADQAVLVRGTISGSGRLTKSGSATLNLSNVDNSAWSGGLQVDDGTLVVTGSKALGGGWLGMAGGTTLSLFNGVDLNNSIELQSDVAVNVDGTDSATLSGSLSAQNGNALTKTGTGTLTLGGGTVAETFVEEGTLRVTGNALNGGNIDIASAGTFEIDTTRVLTYAGQISGSGFLRQGRHSLTLSGDSSAFTGTTVINGGQLNVTGSLGGDVQVTRGGWLTGNGSLGNVFVSGFSTLSPGTTTAAISRLDIAGVLNFDDSSTFQVDLAANGASDFVSVGGSTLLGQANTVAVAADGDWAPSTRYHLLTAAGGVNGTFSGVTSNLAFLDPTLSYDANNVYLTMARNDVSMPDVQLTFPEVVVNTNQQAVAGAVEALGEGNAVYDAVVRLELPQVVPAFDSLSGEVHAAHRGTLLQNRFLHDGIDRHLDGRAISGEISPGLRVWLAGSGGQQRTDATADSTATRVSQDGLMAGAGWQVGAALELGVAAGQQRLETRLRSGTGQAETDSTEYGVYAAYQWQGLRLRGGVTRADYRTDSTRSAQVGSTLSETLVAREDATGTTAFVRAGWTFGASRLQLTPEIELAQVRLESDGSQERGGDSALAIGAADSDYRTGVAALKADWDISGGQRDRAVLTARVGWQYADGDRLPVADARFVAGTRDFSIAGTPLARSTALAQLGVAISPSANSRVSLQVQGRRGGDQRELGAQLDWSVGF
ncbi:autotransporter domain-containing protein [Stenotrophomonas sp.]|uniref:autotransporter domain-containing protein n=1 Tax=Stenotrophomonas sp. TaxID=69392 RepID=UPI00289FD13A|nr:autotransporter domain-containing protein [Stenotrophomonas sp.]